MRTLIVSFLSIIWFISFHHVAQAKTEIIMLFGSDGYAPFYLEGCKSGMFIDFLDEFEKKHPQYKIVKISFPRKRIDYYLNLGEADAFSLTSTLFLPKENLGEFIFSIPIFRTSDHVFMYKGNEFTFEKPDDLFGRRIAIILGNGYGEYDQLIKSKQIKYQAVINWIQLPKLLKIGRVDGFFGNYHATPYKLKMNKFDVSKYIQSQKALYEFPLQTQVHSKHISFLQVYDGFIQASQKNGLLNNIVDKWQMNRN